MNLLDHLQETVTFPRLKKLTEKSAMSPKHIPKSNDNFECLLHSGVIQYSNTEEFKEKVKVYRSLNCTVFYAQDTNLFYLFYHGFLSNCDLIKPERVILVGIVRDEMEASLNYKYSNRQINQLKRLTSFHRDLFNALRKKG